MWNIRREKNIRFRILFLVRKKLTSVKFAEQIEQDLINSCQDKETIEVLKEFAIQNK